MRTFLTCLFALAAVAGHCHADVNATLHSQGEYDPGIQQFGQAEPVEAVLTAGKASRSSSSFPAHAYQGVSFISDTPIASIQVRRVFEVMLHGDDRITWPQLGLAATAWQTVAVGGRVQFDYEAEQDLPKPPLSAFPELKQGLRRFMKESKEPDFRAAARKCFQGGCEPSLTGIEYRVTTKAQPGKAAQQYRLFVPLEYGC